MMITNVQQTAGHYFKPIAHENVVNKKSEPIATVTISDASRYKFTQSLQAQEVMQNDALGKQFRKFYEEFNSIEAIEKRQFEQLEKEQAYNRLEDDLNLGVEAVFPENTLHHTIQSAVEGKVDNASLYASELASALRSSVLMPDLSVEERAAYREMALKQAEYIAENYFDDEQEAKAFMDEVNQYYENDLMREKGYVVIDQSNLQPFKSYSSPLSKDGEVSFSTLAKRYMDEEYFERFINGEGTKEESAKFLMQLKNNKQKYSEEIIGEFEQNKQQVEEAVTDVKALLESFVWENGLVIGSTLNKPAYLEKLLEWNKNMLELFK